MALTAKARTDGIDSLMGQSGCSSIVLCSRGEDLMRENRGRKGEEDARAKSKEKKGRIRMEPRHSMKRNTARVKGIDGIQGKRK
jgi:hypothetical protein